MPTGNEITPNDEMVAILQAEFDLAAKDQSDTAWLPEWFLGKLDRIRLAREAIKARCEEMIAHCDAEERSLHYRWGQQFHEEVDRQLTQAQANGKKAKSLKYLTGQTGYRTSKGRLDIIDTKQAKEWAVDHLNRDELKAAISGLNKTPLAAKVQFVEAVDQQTGEVSNQINNLPAGCVYQPPGEAFYPAAPKKELPMPKREYDQLTEGES